MSVLNEDGKTKRKEGTSSVARRAYSTKVSQDMSRSVPHVIKLYFNVVHYAKEIVFERWGWLVELTEPLLLNIASGHAHHVTPVGVHPPQASLTLGLISFLQTCLHRVVNNTVTLFTHLS